MAGVKSLAKDTAIYGMSSIVGKFLTVWLTPYYAYQLTKPDYATMGYLYTCLALMLVFLTYGLETGFFRFANDKLKAESQTVFSTCMTSLAITTTLFLALIFSFLSPIATALSTPLKSTLPTEYIVMLTIIIALDVLSTLPFAHLRYKQRPIHFTVLKLLNIFLTIFLNLFFITICPIIYKNNPDLISWFYNPEYKVGYILISNLIASAILLLLLIPEIIRIRWSFNFNLLKQILRYSFPLLVLGLAGMMNQHIDKLLLLFLDNNVDTEAQFATYYANAKIAVIMIMFTQAFRYAYEPFIFAKTKGEDKRMTYALAMKYFIIIDLLIFLGVMFFLDILKFFIDPKYFSGLKVVPIIMIADIFAGVFFNLSLWYKLTDRTHWGIYFSLTGLAIIVSMNVTLVPEFGYIACAWAALTCYFVMMFLSWIFGQKYYPINYNLKSIGKYISLAAVLYIIGMWVEIDNLALRLGFRSLLLVVYLSYLIKHDLPLSEIPYIKRFVKSKDRDS